MSDFHNRRLARRLQDPKFREEYKRAIEEEGMGTESTPGIPTWVLFAILFAILTVFVVGVWHA